MLANAKQIIICACGILGIFAIGIVYIVFQQRQISKLTLENTNLTVNLQQEKKTLETQKEVVKKTSTFNQKTRQKQQAVETTNRQASNQEFTTNDYNKTIDEQNKLNGYQK